MNIHDKYMHQHNVEPVKNELTITQKQKHKETFTVSGISPTFQSY